LRWENDLKDEITVAKMKCMHGSRAKIQGKKSYYNERRKKLIPSRDNASIVHQNFVIRVY